MIDLEVERLGATAVVSVREHLDYAAVQELDLALAELLGDGVQRLALDLAAAGALDDSAAGLLFRAASALRDEGGAMAVALPDERQRKALTVMGLDRLFRLVQTRAEAVAALGDDRP